jgi:DNA-binding Lrp family transcriptional regulator
MKLDNKDHRIIEALQDNSRQSIRDLAKKLKIRPSTVHVRIQKLIKEGVIEKFTLKLNNKAIGESFIVFMFIATEKIIPDIAFNSKHVKEVFGITGEYDLLLKLKFSDIEEFNTFILKFRKDYGLKKTLTQIVTANVKEEI